MTNNTEPLKVGEECREAFEQKYGKRDSMFGWFRTYAEHDAAWEVWQAAWNRRTEPSPAEVSSEGLPEPMCVAKGDRFDTYAYTEEQMLELKAERDRWYGAAQERQIEINRLQSICQQSNGTTELTDQLRRQFLTYSLEEGIPQYAANMAWGWICRALNQRLAVKEGEALAQGYVGKYKVCSQRDNTGVIADLPEHTVGADVFIYRAPLYPHPVSDDQQAKDAARLDWLEQHDGRFYNIDRITAVVSVGLNGFKTIRDAIDAAMSLSTTKQEDV